MIFLSVMPKYNVLYKNVKYRDSFTIVIFFYENIVIVIFSLSPSSSSHTHNYTYLIIILQ